MPDSAVTTEATSIGSRRRLTTLASTRTLRSHGRSAMEPETAPNDGQDRITTTATGRMPNYPAPITPAETHPDGCIGCKVEKGPHKWTPPTAAPFCDPDCEVDLATGRCIFCGHPREVEGA